MKRAVIATLAALLVPLASRAAPAAGLDPCHVFTADDAKRALGGPAVRDNASFYGKTICHYHRSSDPAATVLLTLMSPGPGYPYEGYLKMSAGASAGVGRHFTHVAGVGQHADYDGAEHLLFASHGWVLDIGLVAKGLSAGDILAREREAARAVDGRVR